MLSLKSGNYYYEVGVVILYQGDTDTQEDEVTSQAREQFI